jgi:hypothetical protein
LVTSPELNAVSALSAVRVWITSSSLITVMVAPGLTVNFAGWKAKFWIVTVIAETNVGAAAGEVVVLPLPQALRNSKGTIVASAAARR